MGRNRVREQGPENVFVILMNVLCAFDSQMLGVEMQDCERIMFAGCFCWGDK